MSAHTVDARGLRCPIPIIRLAQLAAQLSAGDTIDIVASDPAAEFDVPAWCRMKGKQCSPPSISTDNEGRWQVAFTVVC
ncbi:sulfurtransferase TusA family protein [Timonella sp. A28]|uniref:sulfurtransferase TusA family protein n=1 Tax=Timonella sp. A28 TaxID=3442640 RepID=UPI003EB6B318